MLSNLIDIVSTFIDDHVFLVIGVKFFSLCSFFSWLGSLRLFKAGDVIIPDHLERWEVADRTMKILEVGKNNYLVEYVSGQNSGQKTTISFKSEHNYSRAN